MDIAIGPAGGRTDTGEPPLRHRSSTAARAAATLLVLAGFSAEAGAQAFGPGPPGIAVGSSMSGKRIVGAPRATGGPRIPNADVFGDEVEERRFGRDYDDSYLRPEIRTFERDSSTERRAIEGRSSLGGVGAGVFARDGATGIGRSAVTRPSSSGRAKIVFTKPRTTR